jgi:methionyl-tRNA synthetase
MLRKYSVDSIRYYLTASVTYGADVNFSEDMLVAMHNSELADILGNLIHRVFNLAIKYCDSKIPDCSHDPKCGVPFDLAELKASIDNDAGACAINLAIIRAMDAVRATNRSVSLLLVVHAIVALILLII